MIFSLTKKITIPLVLSVNILIISNIKIKWLLKIKKKKVERHIETKINRIETYKYALP